MSNLTTTKTSNTELNCYFTLDVVQTPNYSNTGTGSSSLRVKLILHNTGTLDVTDIDVAVDVDIYYDMLSPGYVPIKTVSINDSDFTLSPPYSKGDHELCYKDITISVPFGFTPYIQIPNQLLYIEKGLLFTYGIEFDSETSRLCPNTAPTFFANKTNTTQTSISVAINSPVFYGEFSRYEYKIGSITTKKYGINDTSYAFTGLTDNTAYQIVITCVDRNGRSTSITLSDATKKYLIESVTFPDITDDKIYVDEYGNLTITPVFMPSNASVKKLNVTVSSNTFIRASSDNNGVVTVWGLNKSGSTNVTLTLGTTDGSTPFNGDSGKTSEKEFDVYVIRRVTGVELNSNSTLTLMPLLTFTPSITISPAGANDTSVLWTSSNDNVASVNNNGVILGLTEGTATITVTTNDGAKTDSVSVTVTSSMVWEWGEPIYDRTQQDVIDAKNKIAQRNFSGDLKGCLNPSDVNRIVNNIEFLALTRLHTIFGNVPNEFTYADKLNSDDIADILNNINELKSSANNVPFPNTPSDMNYYVSINKIEEILYKLKGAEMLTENAKIEYRVSNAFVSGATIFLPKRG